MITNATHPTREAVLGTQDMTWLQFSLTVDLDQVSGMESLFEGLGALSVTCVDAADQPLLEPGPGETPLWNRTRITALFAADASAEGLEQAIAAALPERIASTLERELLADQVWERVWLKDFHPMRFGRRLWVCPAGRRPDQADALVVDLDPGLAFGTGTHPTTALCLRWLDGADLAGRALMDYGCGSGILAVAGALLGASPVLAVDHDPQALKATRDNAAKNRVPGIRVFAPDEMPDARVDVLLANILAGTLVSLAPRLGRLARPGGQLVLSGILREQADWVAAAYQDSWDLDTPWTEEDWVLLHGRRRRGD